MQRLITIIVALAALVAAHDPHYVPVPTCGLRVHNVDLIWQGTDAARGEFPWLVSLQAIWRYDVWEHFCGGAIISENHVITAAHCMVLDEFRIVFGAYDVTKNENETSVQHIVLERDVVIHGRYSDDVLGDDFALITLPDSLDFTDEDRRLNAICLPHRGMATVFRHNECWLAGWGLLDATARPATILQKTAVRIVPYRRCAVRWQVDNLTVTPRHICAESIDGSRSFPGDSGGPLQCVVNGRYYIAGVLETLRPTGRKPNPDVYGRITSVLRWIRRTQAGEIPRTTTSGPGRK